MDSISEDAITPISPDYEAHQFLTVWWSTEAVAAIGFLALFILVGFTRRSAFSWFCARAVPIFAVLAFICSYGQPPPLRARPDGLGDLAGRLNDTFVSFGCLSLLLAVAIAAVNFMFTRAVANWLRRLRPFDYARALALVLIILPAFNRDHYGESLLPEGYFMLLRWIVCPVLALTAYRAYTMRAIPWAWVYGVSAAIFNPIFISDLGSVWLFVDCVAVALIAASFFLAFGRAPQPGQPSTSSGTPICRPH